MAASEVVGMHVIARIFNPPQGFWINLFGLGAPGLLALIIIPPTLAAIGVENFGVLSLIWGLLIASGALDFGMGRALTRTLARLKDPPHQGQEHLIAAVIAAVIIGIAAGIILILIACFLPETISSRLALSESNFPLLLATAACLPAQAASVVARGYYEGTRNFRSANIQRVTINIVTLVAPLALHGFSMGLLPAVIAMCTIRVAAVVILMASIGNMKSLPTLHLLGAFKNLWGFSSLFTVENIVKSISGQLDRIFLWVVGGAAAVTMLAVPSSAFLQLLLPLGAYTSALFPKLCAVDDLRQAYGLTVRSMWAVGLIFGIVSFCIFLMGDIALGLWLGEGYEPIMSDVLINLSWGLPFYAVASIATSFLHSAGAVKTTLTVSCLSVLTSLFIMSVGWSTGGIATLALYWPVKFAIEAATLTIIAKRLAHS